MPNYHFFKQGQALTYLDANAPSYSDERRQLVEQGFAAIAAPTFADTPAEALELLRTHQALQDEANAKRPLFDGCRYSGSDRNSVRALTLPPCSHE
ncbi:hypothetical protein ACTG2W_18520 [Aeromonas sp. 96A]|uniref:hypothetical protein n=1 Tax=Aeromonas TaxID=642 RepID=UPI003A409792